MEIFSENITRQFKNGSAVTLGNFDGIHLGHQMLINTTKKYADELGLESIVYSFYPHPVSVIKKNEPFYTILTPTEKAYIIEQYGIDVLVQQPFSLDFANLDTVSFVEMLVEKTNCKVLVVGEDYCFGKNRSGNFDTLCTLGEKYGFKAVKISAVNLMGGRVSSTRIRQCIKERAFMQANALLAKPYFIMGRVKRGKQLGRKLGYPTANLELSAEKLFPDDGVYITRTEYKGNIYNSITNIGKNPTVNGIQRTVETHLFDFDYEIYDETIKVMFYENLRNETKFQNIEELKSQINADKQKAESYLKDRLFF